MRQRLGEYEEPDPPFGLVGEQREEVAYEERPRRLPTALLTVVAMAVFAGGLWFAYHQGLRNAAVSVPGGSNENVPLIRADERPVKVKPDQPGGMDVPDRDKLVFTEKPGGPAVEKLLPPAEQPRPVPPSPPPQPAPPIGAMLNPIAPGPVSPPPQTSDDTPPKAAKPPPATATSTAKPPAKPAPEPKAPAETKLAAAPKPPTNSAPAAPQTGGVRVQLGSLRSAEAARDEWNRLKQANPDVLGKLTAVAVRADLGEKGIYYRIQAGPLADTTAADHLCSELKKRNLGCTLVR
jgi:hypothetical protein